MKATWIGVYSHEHGVDVDLYTSEQDAWHIMAQIAFDNVQDVLDDPYLDNPLEVIKNMVIAYRKGKYEEVCDQFAYGRSANMEVRAVDMENVGKKVGTLSEEYLKSILAMK